MTRQRGNLLSLAAWFVDALVRWRHRFGTCPHWMVRMTDGPCCMLCGRAWQWRDRPPHDDD